MIRKMLGAVAALVVGVCLAGPANAIVVKHTITVDSAFVGVGCPVAEQPECFYSPEPIFGLEADSIVAMQIEMVFRTGTSARLLGFDGPTKATITVNGVTRVFNAHAGAGFDAEPCTNPVYIFECKGAFNFYMTLTDSMYSGGAFGSMPIFWLFGEPLPDHFNVNGFGSAGNIDGDGMGYVTIADRTGHSVGLFHEYFEFESRPLSSIPLPSALPLLISGLALLGWASARDRGKAAKHSVTATATLIAFLCFSAPAGATAISVKPGDVWDVFFSVGQGTFYDVYCDTPGCQFQMVANLNKFPFAGDPGFINHVLPAKTCGYEDAGEAGMAFEGTSDCGFVGDSGGMGDWYSTHLRLSGFTGSFTVHAFGWLHSPVRAVRAPPVPLPAALPLLAAALGLLGGLGRLTRRA